MKVNIYSSSQPVSLCLPVCLFLYQDICISNPERSFRNFPSLKLEEIILNHSKVFRESCLGGPFYSEKQHQKRKGLLTSGLCVCIYIYCSGYTQPLQEVKKKTGADLQFDSNQTFVPGMKILRISGVPKQIEAALRLINQMTGVKVCRLIVVIECNEVVFIELQSHMRQLIWISI